ncbi:sensor histidine kinase [Polaribacter sp. WD7]|uniref:sensor histidine kinase n=1 Tax=Polaribacter sp. WD7 TaxID=2269061 RepID=UPI000DF49916|nr:HAMP domain-containing sensor histidine kinase [Polaribacter sp. WD7]RCS28261.1 sensor histidine kinase [Polaribacter sp. WD7]
MNVKKQQWILYLITITILITIGIQFYWNYKNYKTNQQIITNEIQLSLDNAIEEYYAFLAKNDFITIVNSKKNKDSLKNITSLSRWNTFKTQTKNKKKVTLNNIKITSDEHMSQKEIDSIMNSTKNFVTKFNRNDSNVLPILNRKLFTQFLNNKEGITLNSNGKKTAVTYFKGKKAADSLRFIKNIKPIFISFLNNNVDYKKMDSLIKNQLNTKDLILETSLHHLKQDTLFYAPQTNSLDSKDLFINAKSTFVKNGETFKLYFNSPHVETLKRSFFGILLSLLLSTATIASLFYLLRIIKQQKDLANIKNDLISNITHEFKTPIATVSTAIEAIENFNVLEDETKTKKYLALSSVQLKKLHQMVEKLLETATLDSEKLILKKENIDTVKIIERLVIKHKLLSKKELIFSTNLQPIHINVDVFHFENCISNLIDNAIKYGGNKIQIHVNSVLNSVEIAIADNGKGIDKKEQEKIFDKFYRVPKGNTHDVKGFGIGLYYCKKIIEKHKGIITLITTKNTNTFKINLPNE